MNNIKKCSTCNNFFDISNNNFFLNLAISKHINKNTISKTIIDNFNKNINLNTGIEWCLCYNEEKKSYITEAETYKKIGFKNNNTFIGNLDFALNKNIFYIKSKKFDDIDFLSIQKELKFNLTNNEDFSFDFLTYDKLTEENFIKDYKKFFNKPSYLMINDMHLLKENQIEILKNILLILKERISNNLYTFILSSTNLIEFKTIINQNQWIKYNNITKELEDILNNNFILKNITIDKKNKKLDLITSNYEDIKKTQKKTNIKKEEKEEKSLADFD